MRPFCRSRLANKSNDPFSLGSCRDSQETPRLRLSPSPCLLLVQLLPLPYCQRTSTSTTGVPALNLPRVYLPGVACCTGIDARLLQPGPTRWCSDSRAEKPPRQDQSQLLATLDLVVMVMLETSVWPVNPPWRYFFVFAPFFRLVDSVGSGEPVASALQVEMGGLEPPTSCLQSTRSPSELHPRLRRPPEWAYLDSNQGPQLYQSCALAN
jgi:hypothetical protein